MKSHDNFQESLLAGLSHEKTNISGASETIVQKVYLDKITLLSQVTAFLFPVTHKTCKPMLPFLRRPEHTHTRAAHQSPASSLQVLYYSTSLFTAAGLEEWQSKYATLGVGSVMVIMTLVSIPLMDRAGRRTLHLYGLGGMFIFSIFITISLLIKEMMSWMTFVSVFSTLCFVIFFSVGPGSIPWMITAELFSQGPRPAAMSIAVLVNWLSNFIVGIGFPKMQETFENYTFLPFSVLLACFWIFTYYKVPETKNKTFEEISAIFTRGGDRSTLNCVNTLGSKPLEAEHAALIRELSGRAHQQSPSARSDRSDGPGGLGRRGSEGSNSCGGSSRAESGVSSSRASSQASSPPDSSASSRQSVIAQTMPHPSEPPV
ncbi:Glucose transporter type 1 [Chionoecetes opilio]|uniref:Glucose transporter type 1 n=1 Tax=Chionoecetes opilio TaxID=41210 RepID=A0A8J4YEK6_CHIOP|nr:Glucose transporter type 1 [Chionoecetes opilio]